MEKLREVRLAKGLNQRELAERSHTAQSLVSALERGVVKPWPKVAKKLARALGASVEELFPAEGGDSDGRK